MALTLVQKLRIKENMVLLTVDAPADFQRSLGKLPAGVSIVKSGKKINQVHWFVKNQAEMHKKLSSVVKLLTGDVLCWAYYPKGTSGIQTDLSRDKGWEALLAQQQFQWITLVSFNDTWSAFAFRLENKSTSEMKEVKPKAVRDIFQYVDPAKKTVRLPDDLAALFKKHSAAARAFDALSFTNKKEYVEWIVTAKKPETRRTRLSGAIERLKNGWKNSAASKPSLD